MKDAPYLGEHGAGELRGLPMRVAHALITAGFVTRSSVADAVKYDDITAVQNLGKVGVHYLRKWLGLKSTDPRKRRASVVGIRNARATLERAGYEVRRKRR